MKAKTAKAADFVGSAAFCVEDVWLSDVFGPVFEVGLEVGHEFAGVGSVDGAVVEAEGEALDASDGDGVLAVFVS